MMPPNLTPTAGPPRAYETTDDALTRLGCPEFRRVLATEWPSLLSADVPGIACLALGLRR
jgi:hypothetical protein